MEANFEQIPEAQEFKSRDEIYGILKHLPLYKRRGREEVFLGILKSKNKQWPGWQYIYEIRKEKNFSDLVMELGLYELAINYWIFQIHGGFNNFNIAFLSKQYDF